MSRGWLERNQGRPPREVGGRWAPSQADVRLFFSFLRSIDDLYPPRLSISSSYDLEHILPQLGMKLVFIRSHRCREPGGYSGESLKFGRFTFCIGSLNDGQADVWMISNVHT